MRKNTSKKPAVDLREQVVSQLFEKIQAGDSVSVIGISNIGKSNLIEQLLDPEVQKQCLDEPGKFSFLRINFHNLPDFSNRSVYSLILEQMEMLGSDEKQGVISEEELRQIEEYHRELLNAAQDELKIQRFFKLAVRLFFKEAGRRLVLLFDQFDRLYQRAGDQLFYNLRGLRDTYKYRISYLVFTNDALPDIPVMTRSRPSASPDGIPQSGADAEAQKEESEPEAAQYARRQEQAREEFFELLQPNQLYLKPYSLTDTRSLLRRVAARKGIAFHEAVTRPLYWMTGGHAGLLRMCYIYAVESGMEKDLPKSGPEALLEVESIEQECDRIWASLNEREQYAIAARSREISVSYVDKFTEAGLENKGLVTEEGKIFSPLFERYAKKKKTRLDRPIYIDVKRQTVYVHGSAAVRLSKAEYQFIKKLYDRENSVVSQEEIFHALWPNEEFDQVHSPQSLSTIAYRVRTKLGLSEKNGELQAKHKQGYILNNQMAEEED